MLLHERPIPECVEPPNWRRIPIVGNDIPLVVVAAADRLDVRPAYHLEGIPGAPAVVRVRADVHAALIRASNSLPDPLGLRVMDGHRPVAVQQWLWDREWQRAMEAFPDADDAQLTEHVGRYVARPTADPLAPPPHRSGGAVDVVLFRRTDGQPVDCGTPFDAPLAASATRHCEPEGANPEHRGARRTLFHAMEDAGFANYPGEWWHFDLGNQRWANLRGLACARHGIPVDE